MALSHGNGYSNTAIAIANSHSLKAKFQTLALLRITNSAIKRIPQVYVMNDT